MSTESARGASAAALRAVGLVAGHERTPVVHGVDLHVGAGEVVALVGANGAGKTTTLLAISGLVPVFGGTVEFGGRTQRRSRRVRTTEVWRTARAGLAHVPEDRGLFYDLTVAEHLRLGGAAVRSGLVARRQSDEQPTRFGGANDEDVLELFPALRDKRNRRAGLLSGGEQQMLAVARAVATRPKVLLVDELSLGLAPIVVEQLLPTLRSVASELNCGVVVVEQHVPLVLELADRGYVMERGRVVMEGDAADLAARIGQIESGYLGTTGENGRDDGTSKI